MASTTSRLAQFGWYRFIPFLGYHHVLMILIVISVILTSILLGGCSNESLSNVYLVSLAYTDLSSLPTVQDPSVVNPNASSIFATLRGHNTALEIRVGYMGMCMWEASGQWICSSSAADLAALVRQAATEAGPTSGLQTADPLNLIYMAETFKNEIVFDVLIFISAALAIFVFLILCTFPGWHEAEGSDVSDPEVKPFPSRPLAMLGDALIAASSMLSLLAALWQHIGSAAAVKMAEVLSYGTVTGHVGAAAMALGWASFALFAIVFAGLTIMIISIRVLAQLMG